MTEIIVDGKLRGRIDVAYREEKPEFDEGPFLKEERSLLEAVAREVAIIIKRKETEEDQRKLQHQLRHADRLATIGQLAAGIAHELNEPLGNILGFAQLAKKSPELPKGVGQDIEKILSASLYAREVIKKMLVFARQIPPQKKEVHLNQLVEESLSFFKSRLAGEGVEISRSFAPDLPVISADPVQLNQVIVNLILNALQAMSKGGQLTIKTLASRDHILLIIEDTGMGMTEEVMGQIFTPFFTTKGIGQGTGLGLPVVHGIITSHGGSIHVESKVGYGSRFEIHLPINGRLK
jgi:signal transduction histidine kinase